MTEDSLNEKKDVEVPPVGGADEEALQPEPITEKVDHSTIAPPPPAVENLVTRDGIRVHPQPTSDPLDPLNWTSFQKHSILAIVMFK